ncbi:MULTISPECIES: C4-dicarboxylate TRAP transporter substrate-binding protein [unclassified Roseitalea]|uniref:C4-dicarboxylate TRAP transporter substrate-binding protein n=1 Tax=unclassified Roseitalea TaxID=2639107 RepID=UPI00273EDDE1|nr:MULTISPECIES: C4-dicarboxylate TRAP transporter substrate-binding protein [unclassified Roseitalea]
MTSTRFARPAGLALAAAVTLTAGTALAQEYTFRIPHVTSASEPVHEALEHFASLLEERSDGRIEAEVFAGGQLGTNLEMYEQVDLGAQIIILADPGYLSDFLPDFGILNGPYLLDEPGDFQKIVNSDWYAGLVDQLRDDTNLELLALNWFFGDRNVISNQEVRTVDDFDGLSIRVPPNVMWIETFKALGARGEQVAWPEVYGALASGVVDAAEAPLGSIYGASLYESAKTISMTGHFYAWIGLAMNDELFASMPEDLQDVLRTSALDAGDFMTNLVQEKQGEFIDMLEAEGVTFVEEVDRAAMREATLPVYEAFPAWSDGLVDTVQSILAE